MPRADEDTRVRTIQRNRLRDYITAIGVGGFVPMAEWYGRMDRLGLVHSHRQRLSELREEGYMIRHDRKRNGYIFYGIMTDNQIPLEV